MDIPSRRDLQAKARTSGSDIYINVMFRAFFPLPTPPVPPISSTGGVVSTGRDRDPLGQVRPIEPLGPVRPLEPLQPARPIDPDGPHRPVPRAGRSGRPGGSATAPDTAGRAGGDRRGAGPHPRVGRHAGHAASRSARARSGWRRFAPRSRGWRSSPRRCSRREFFGVLDVCNHRVDAWFTALATKRLESLRATGPQGIVIGGWGCLQDVRRTRRQRSRAGKPSTSTRRRWIRPPPQR